MVRYFGWINKSIIIRTINEARLIGVNQMPGMKLIRLLHSEANYFGGKNCRARFNYIKTQSNESNNSSRVLHSFDSFIWSTIFEMLFHITPRFSLWFIWFSNQHQKAHRLIGRNCRSIQKKTSPRVASSALAFSHSLSWENIAAK